MEQQKKRTCACCRREKHVARYKQGYTDQGRGKENAFQQHFEENGAGSGVFVSCFFPLVSLGESIAMRKNHKRKNVKRKSKHKERNKLLEKVQEFET